MRRNLILIAIVTALIAGGTLLFDQWSGMRHFPADHPEISVLKADKAPDFSFVTLKNQPGRLSDFRGKVVLLNFWASWCAPCVIEFPKLEELAKNYPDHLAVLAISADTDRAEIEKFLHRIKYEKRKNMLIVHDKDKRISQDLFQTIKFPETIIIDPAGRMVRKVVGDTDWTGEEMKAYLSDLARENPIPYPLP
jgi:thiol-disulfide isomerase/thioredoxin